MQAASVGEILVRMYADTEPGDIVTISDAQDNTCRYLRLPKGWIRL